MARTRDTVVAEVASRLRLDTSSSATLLAMVQGWVNDVIEDVQGRHDWFWTLDRQIVQTVIDKTAGTIAVAASGTAVTGASTAFAASDVGKYINFAGSDDWYKITAVGSSLGLTIEGEFNGTTALTAATYTIRKLFYSLPAAEKLISAKQNQTGQDLVCINHKDFDAFLTFGDSTGPAREFAVYGVDSSGYLQFSIYPHADEAYNLEVKYKKKATEDSIEATPEKWRGVYIDGALTRGLEYIALGQTGFDRGLIALKAADYERGLIRMLGDAEPESDYHPVLMNRDVANAPRFPHLPETMSIPQD